MNELVYKLSQSHLINANILRLVTVIFAIFIVRILVNFFKYNVRLAAFYRSRAWAFQLSGLDNLERVKTFTEALAVEKIDFEKEDYSSVTRDVVANLTGNK